MAEAAVEYFESELMPGRPMFGCARLSATLQVSTCSEMWRLANGPGRPEHMARCTGCALGAKHSGVVDPTRNGLRGKPVCSRCLRTALRLIGGNVCVGCKNREYEWVKGRNARGKAPTKHPELKPRRVQYAVSGVVRVLERSLTASSVELVVELLRDSKSRVVFGLGRGCLR